MDTTRRNLAPGGGGSTDVAGMLAACRVDELADGESMRLDVEPPVALFRVGEEFYATADSCTHEEWSLGEEGELHGHQVTCPLHLAQFDVRDGRALCLPATVGLRTHRVRVVDGVVLVALEPGD